MTASAPRTGASIPRILACDVFGTVVDWHGSVMREIAARAEEGWDSSLYASVHSDVSTVVVRVSTPLPSRVIALMYKTILRPRVLHHSEKTTDLMKIS